MKKRLLLALVSALAAGAAQPTMAQNNNAEAIPTPPVARRIAKAQTFHGEDMTDQYFWLREKGSKEVTEYLEAENAYADAVTKNLAPLADKLYKEILSRIKQTDTNVPSRDNGYYYYTRTVEGKQYPIFARKKGSLDAPEEITLDVNAMAEGHKFYSVGNYSVSHDGNLLAYSVDTTGFREYTLHIKDLRTGKNLADELGVVDYAFFAPDNKTLFYGRHDKAKRPYQVWRHTLGEPTDKDVLVYEEKDELYRAGAGLSRDKQFITISAGSSNNNEVRYIPADKPASESKLILPRSGMHEYYVTSHGKNFLIRTNDKGRGFRLVSAPISDPRPENWKEIIPARKGVTLEGLTVFKDFYVVSERDQGVQKHRVVDFKTNKEHFLEHPEPVYSAGLNFAEFDSGVMRYGYQSFITPFTVYDYDMRTRKKTLLKQTEVLGGYDPSKYKSERILATAADGVKVPVSLYYRADLRKPGTPQLLWLYAYGSYGAPSNVGFSSTRLSMIDRGFVYAIAHIRGGGDLGREWHDEGKMMKKKNTFTDFIAAAEHLIREKYTTKDQLVISGGSAGGLLMGAVVNMRPDLFKVVLSYVPFVDVINTMYDASLPLTAQEWLEWGNPNNKDEYAYMKSYSPYDNIAAKEYPTMLVRTSLNDSQVMYWEPAKYVAKLRAMKTDKNPLVFKTNMGAGHGGASGRYDALKDTAWDYAFVLSQFGINN
ncbi:MAG TPA: S9 family peptidase [Pyrinomonadaceae bacterium]|nr:S9 family peptidase [Pyrinomonadaceae bacterium]